MLTLLPDRTAGRGHVSRCEALAAAWDGVSDWTVVDTYRDEPMPDGRVLVIDDHGSRGHYDADLVLDHNLGATAEPYADRTPRTRLLLGEKYLLLRPGFDPLDIPRQGIVLSGGGAPSERVSALLGQLPGEMVGGDMARCLGGAELMIGAAGVTSYEACRMGTPMVLFAVADNQEPLGERLAARGAAVYLGRIEELDRAQIDGVVRGLLADRDRLAEMGSIASSVVDGQGAKRVTAQMRSFDVTLRSATADDLRLLWEWANDPETRAQSFDPSPIGWDEHVAWFEQQREVFVGVVEGVPMGQIRFDGDVLSYSVAPGFRGRGWAAPLLITGTVGKPVRALVKPGNTASHRALDRAGFTRVDEGTWVT